MIKRVLKLTEIDSEVENFVNNTTANVFQMIIMNRVKAVVLLVEANSESQAKTIFADSPFSPLLTISDDSDCFPEYLGEKMMPFCFDDVRFIQLTQRPVKSQPKNINLAGLPSQKSPQPMASQLQLFE